MLSDLSGGVVFEHPCCFACLVCRVVPSDDWRFCGHEQGAFLVHMPRLPSTYPAFNCVVAKDQEARLGCSHVRNGVRLRRLLLRHCLREGFAFGQALLSFAFAPYWETCFGKRDVSCSFSAFWALCLSICHCFYRDK